MKNYKAMKTAKSWSVKKAKVVDQAAVSEVTDDDGNVVRAAEAEKSHNELQLVQKRFDSSNGKALDDSVQSYELNNLASDISRVKADISRLQDEQADMEELEKDLKAL
jgi:hypothetical protein